MGAAALESGPPGGSIFALCDLPGVLLKMTCGSEVLSAATLPAGKRWTTLSISRQILS